MSEIDSQLDDAIKVLDGLQNDININLFPKTQTTAFTDNFPDNIKIADSNEKNEENNEKKKENTFSNNNGYSDVMKLLENSTKTTSVNGGNIHHGDEAQKMEQYIGTRKKVFLDAIPKKPKWVWNRAPNLFQNDAPLPAAKIKNKDNQTSTSKASLKKDQQNSNNKTTKDGKGPENLDDKDSKVATKTKTKISPLYNVSGMDSFLERCDYANYQRLLKKENLYHIETGYSQNIPMILCESHNIHIYEEGFEQWNFSIDIEDKKATYKRNNNPSKKAELLETKMMNRSPGCIPKSINKNPYKLYKDLAKQIAIESILTEQQKAK